MSEVAIQRTDIRSDFFYSIDLEPERSIASLPFLCLVGSVSQLSAIPGKGTVGRHRRRL